MGEESWAAMAALVQVTVRLAGGGGRCMDGCHGSMRVEAALLRAGIVPGATEEALVRCGSRSVRGSATLAEVASVEGVAARMAAPVARCGQLATELPNLALSQLR